MYIIIDIYMYEIYYTRKQFSYMAGFDEDVVTY